MEGWLEATGWIGLMSALYLTVGVSTVVGQRKRGGHWWHLLLAVALWPVAWTIWYVADGRAQTSSVADSHHRAPRLG